MKLNLTINIDVDDTDPHVEERILEIADREAKDYVQRLLERLKTEGVTDVEARVQEG